MNFTETRLGFSIGDVNGIGPEVLLKAFSNEVLFNHCTPVVYGSSSVLKFYMEELNIETEMDIYSVTSAKQAKAGRLNVVDVQGADYKAQPGSPSKESGALALNSLLAAVEAVKNGEIENLVTLPIDKNTIQSETFNFAGHTDFLASTFTTEEYMMILCNDDLRVGIVSGHVPITEVSKAVNPENLKTKIDTLLHSLRFDFGVRKPKLAVLGLNPHSGDNGLIGKEEQEVIIPVIQSYIEAGELVYGPYAADGFFGSGSFEQFDAILAMYHDQGLIPFKQIAFKDGVNYTAGLPIVRTSPDHGTAYDIAGKGVADADSLVAAIFATKTIYRNRLEYNELNKSPLGFKVHRKEKFSIGVPNLK